MRIQVVSALALAAVVLAVTFTIAPKTTVIADEVTGGVYRIDVLAITRDAKDMPVQQYAAH